MNFHSNRLACSRPGKTLVKMQLEKYCFSIILCNTKYICVNIYSYTFDKTLYRLQLLCTKTVYYYRVFKMKTTAQTAIIVHLIIRVTVALLGVSFRFYTHLTHSFYADSWQSAVYFINGHTYASFVYYRVMRKKNSMYSKYLFFV